MENELGELLKFNAIEIDKEIEKLIPREVDFNWLSHVLDRLKYDCDEVACKKAIVDPIWDLIERGGKRWRPLLMKLSYELVGRRENFIEKFLIIPELIHNGTLIIDDIEDDSDLRRGKPCVHHLFGKDISINAGNALYYLPLLVIAKDESLDCQTKLRLYEIINRGMIDLSFGQGMDIYWHNNDCNVMEREYLQMCCFKTGTLARISAGMGGALGGADDREIEALQNFAESIGVAFQIQDDILNVTNLEWGKDFGEDISEGKKSLVVIKTLLNSSENDNKRLREILALKTKRKELVLEAIGIINKYSGIEESKKFARKLILEAWKEIDSVFPDCESKKKLKLFADFMVDREI